MQRQRFILASGFAILIAVSAVSVALVLKTRTEARWVEHTLLVLSKLSDLQIEMRGAESSQRGLLLSGDQQFLEDRHKAAERVLPLLAELKTLTDDNPDQQKLLADIEPLLRRRIVVLEDTLKAYLARDSAALAMLVSAAEGPRLMTALATRFDRFATQERDLLASRSAQSHETANILLAVELVGAVLILAIASASIWIAYRAGRDREAALRQAEAANAHLAEAVAERTEHLHRANAEIRREAAIFESIMTTIAEAVLLVDQTGRILYANRAYRDLLGTPSEVNTADWIATHPLFNLDGVTPVPTQERPIVRCLRGELIDSYELLYRTADSDKLKNVAGSARPIRDAAGMQTGAVIVFRDVTEARLTERQLNQSQKLDAIGQLTGGVAHDFNNMLTVICGTTEMLVEGLADRPHLLAIAKLIDQAAGRGAELTKHLLAFARKQPLQPRDVDINTLVLDTAKLLRPTLGEHIEIEAMLNEDVLPARIDPSQLSSALLNLAVNARDAMPDGGKLTLETRNVQLDDAYASSNAEVQPGAYVLIAVSDTGTGIPAHLRDKVIEPFFTTKQIGKGTGLGLSMVYGFAKQSGGHIKIYSEEGHGTTVRLYLPHAGAQAETAAAAAPAIAHGSETILVVEDDALVREFVVAQLHSLGYTTVTAADGATALAHITAGLTFDLLFTDVIMPGGMNGRQLADAIARRRPGVKILYTSGYTENAIVHHGRLDPGVLLLAKPYRKSDLARMVRAALEKSAGGANATASDHVLPAIRRQG